MLGIVALLAATTLGLAVAARVRPMLNLTELNQRVRSWWLMAGIFFFAVLLSPSVSIIFLGLVSFLALKEYFSLIETRRADRRVLLLAYLAIPAQYYLVAQGSYGFFIIFIPVFMFLLLPVRMVLIGETPRFLAAVGTLQWGLMTCVFSLSHAAYLLVLPFDDQPKPDASSPAAPRCSSASSFSPNSTTSPSSSGAALSAARKSSPKSRPAKLGPASWAACAQQLPSRFSSPRSSHPSRAPPRYSPAHSSRPPGSWAMSPSPQSNATSASKTPAPSSPGTAASSTAWTHSHHRAALHAPCEIHLLPHHTMKPLRFFFYVALVRPLAHLCLGVSTSATSAHYRPTAPSSSPRTTTPTSTPSSSPHSSRSAQARASGPSSPQTISSAPPLRAWLSTNILGALPLSRTPSTHAPDPLAPLDAAIAQGDILIIFPEGSRGIPEQRSALKSGIIHLLKRAPGTPVLPVFMHGLGKALPRGERIPVPFFCDVIVGEPLLWNNDRNKFMTDLEATLDQLARQLDPKPWR